MEKLRYDMTNGLSTESILEIIKYYEENIVPQEEEKNEYAKGNNVAIEKRVVPTGSPNNKVAISYARKIINTVTGYMYKPGLITYTSENQAYLDALQAVFDDNDEPVKTEKMGRQTSIHGFGYEMLYLMGADPEQTIFDGEPGFLRLVPKFVKLPVCETIPIYNEDIEPKLNGFIRFYTNTTTGAMHVFVYDKTYETEYLRTKDVNILQRVGKREHGIGDVPLIVYENNEDLIGDFQCVLRPIDAYDVLMSDSLNEFDRFAWAYLIMKGFKLADGEEEQIKHKRAFMGLSEEDSVSFLTKDINHEYIKFMAEWVRGEIHRQSGVPNIDDYKFGGDASGATIEKFIYLMELFTDPKESYFREGLRERIRLITLAANLNGDPKEIDIIMSRNKPDSNLLNAEIFEKYDGRISRRTLIENFADFVKNVDDELALIEEEKDLYDTGLDNEPDGTTEENGSDDSGNGEEAQEDIPGSA